MDSNTKGGPALSPNVLSLLTVPRRVYAAVSGGADSLAVAALLDDAKRTHSFLQTPAILHVHHGLRGKDADADERFVADWAKVHGWRFCSTHVDAAETARQTGQSIETAARVLRYTFFARVVEEEWVEGEAKPLLFLGHHLQDQAESILFHILRGCGPDGLSGMTEIEERPAFFLVRPLLSVTKEQILQFHRDRYSSWREDHTNQQMEATRNRLRGMLFPAIRQEINPAVDDALVRLSTIAREENAYLEMVTAAAFAQISTNGKKAEPFSASSLSRNACFLQSIALSREKFLAQPVALQRRLVRHWVARLAETGETATLSFEDEEEIRRHFERPSGKCLSLYGMMFLTDFEGVHALSLARFQALEKEAGEGRMLSVEYDGQPFTLYSGQCALTRVTKVDSATVSSLASLPAACCAVDATGLEALTWRCAQPGDTFVSFGGGSKPLRKMWNAWHIPAVLRQTWPILTDGKDILWVLGLGRSAKRVVQPGRDMVVINWRRI